MRDGKIKIAPLYSPSASAMIISGQQCPGEGGEKCNKILLKNNIYSDQGPVPDAQRRQPHRKHIFIQIIKNTFICFDPNLTASEKILFLKKVSA